MKRLSSAALRTICSSDGRGVYSIRGQDVFETFLRTYIWGLSSPLQPPAKRRGGIEGCVKEDWYLLCD